jgi:transcriptional regulator with XRE-family HTH domain
MKLFVMSIPSREQTELRIDAEHVANLRTARGWTQAELAEAASLNLRTVQRIEATAAASLRSKRALANALDVDIHDLDDKELSMSPCPHCGSDEVFESERLIDTTTIGGELLPKLASGAFSSAKMRAVVCRHCGLLRYFVDEGARDKLTSSKHWRRV